MFNNESFFGRVALHDLHHQDDGSDDKFNDVMNIVTFSFVGVSALVMLYCLYQKHCATLSSDVPAEIQTSEIAIDTTGYAALTHN